MIKYEIEGNIDFYKELNEINNNEMNAVNDNICLITNEPLGEYYVTLKCKHSFNYVPIYNDIYYSKFKINSGSVVLGNYPTNKIKCPYCRNIQSQLLPYHEELNLPMIYGINTDNYLYNVVKNRYNKFVYASTLSYVQGVCCFITKPENDNNICKNTNVILHGETKKTYCYEHICIVKKEYNEHIKNMKKQANKLKKQQEKEMKKQEQKEQGTSETVTINKCQQILKTGKNKGKVCGCNVYLLDKCKKHVPKINI